MRAGKGASRPSVLVINPRNEEASAARRVRLLAAFNALPEDDRADLLEAAETMVSRASADVDSERDEVRVLFRRIYVVAGWEEASDVR